jgi:hypothetical protein
MRLISRKLKIGSNGKRSMNCFSDTRGRLRFVSMPKPKKDGRVIFRIQLTPQAKDNVEGFCAELGMTQIAMASRLVEWFGSQPDTIKAAVLGLYPGVIQNDVAALVLKRMQDQQQIDGKISHKEV